MGKKGKKGKKKGGGGKKKEPQMTAKEAILAYQISIVEKKLEDVNFEKNGWEEKNRRHEERNAKLLEEQGLLIENLLKQAREVEKHFDGEDVKTREDVIVVMKEKWERQRELEKEIEEIKNRIAKKDAEIDGVRREVRWWQNYRDRGQYDRQKEIRILEQEIADMKNNFDEMAGHLQRDLEGYKRDLENYTESVLSKQKDLASDKAIAHLDKKSRTEVLDNDWLRREVAIHRVEVAEMAKEVELLEQHNLEVMSKLFECTIEDLKVSRNFFMTQFSDEDSLKEGGLLEMDLQDLSITALKKRTGDLTLDMSSKAERPKSAMQAAVERKVFSLITPQHDTEVAEAEESAVAPLGDVTEVFDNLFYEEEDFSDYLQLGPLELKLLNVTGAQMPIHAPEQRTQEELEAQDCNPDEWPVTKPMLRSVVSPSPRAEC